MRLPSPCIGLGGPALSIALLSGCLEGGIVCTAEARSSFSVEIRDSLSGVGLAGSSIAVVEDGEFVDTLWTSDAAFKSGGVFERPGTYGVTITSAGYTTWTLAGVEVEDGKCHVETANLLARLQPE
jgi:hypothetical protein